MTDKKTYKRKLGRGGKYDSIIQYEEDVDNSATHKYIEFQGMQILSTDQEKELRETVLAVEELKSFAEDFLLKNPKQKDEKDPPLKLSQRRRAMCIKIYADKVKIHLKTGTHMYAISDAMELQQEVDNLILSDWEEYALIGQQFSKRKKEIKYTKEIKEIWKNIATELWKKEDYLNKTKRNGKYNIRKTALEIERLTGNGFESIKDFLEKMRKNEKS